MHGDRAAYYGFTAKAQLNKPIDRLINIFELH